MAIKFNLDGHGIYENMKEMIMIKKADKKKSFNRCEKAYMSSYDWNYMVLDIVDYIQSNLSSTGENEGITTFRGLSELSQGKRDLVDIKKDLSIPDTTVQKGKVDEWKYFKKYCATRSLNWRVIRKMIEYTTCESFDCEANIANYKEFKALTKEECLVAVQVVKKSDGTEVEFIDSNANSLNYWPEQLECL
jgi:hypothetical protein